MEMYSYEPPYKVFSRDKEHGGGQACQVFQTGINSEKEFVHDP